MSIACGQCTAPVPAHSPHPDFCCQACVQKWRATNLDADDPLKVAHGPDDRLLSAEGQGRVAWSELSWYPPYPQGDARNRWGGRVR